MDSIQPNSKRTVVSKDHFAFWLIAGCSILTAALAPVFLPSRFYNDALILTVDLYNEIGWHGSFPLTIAFYKYTGLGFLHYSLLGLVQVSILFAVLYKIGVPQNFSRLTLKNGMVWLSFFLLGIFISMPSKEFINFLVIAIIPLLFYRTQSTRVFVLVTTALFLVFGLMYRGYYILIPFLSVLFYLVSRITLKRKVFFIFFLGLFAVIALSLSYSFIKGDYFSGLSREKVNSERLYSDEAATMIQPPLKVETWYGEAVSIVYGFFTVNLPVNGLKFLLKPQVLAFVIWQLLLFGLLIWGFANCLRSGFYYSKMLWIFFFVFAYFIIQGVFEPDLGSAVKHKLGIFPLIYFTLYYDYFRKNI